MRHHSIFVNFFSPRRMITVLVLTNIATLYLYVSQLRVTEKVYADELQIGGFTQLNHRDESPRTVITHSTQRPPHPASASAPYDRIAAINSLRPAYQGFDLRTLTARLAIEQRYADLLVTLHLSPDMQNRLIELLTERELAPSDVQLARRKLNYDISPQEAQALATQEQSSTDEQISHLLSASDFRNYRDYTASWRQHMEASTLAAHIAYLTGMPLNQTTINRLGVTLHAALEQLRKDTGNRFEMFPAARRQSAVIASGLLSNSQEAAVRDYYSQLSAWERLQPRD